MKNQQPAIVPHITPLRIRSSSREKNPHHSASNSSFMSTANGGTGNKIFGDPGGLDYIGLRVNKDHASCNQQHLHLPNQQQSTFHSSRPSHHRLDISPNMLQSRNYFQQPQSLLSVLPNYQHSHTLPNSPNNQQLVVVDVNALMNNINGEFQRFIDVDLRTALNDMKNQLFEQQFGFERQIINHIDKLQQEFENREPQVIVQQPELSNSMLDPNKNYALQEDLKLLEDNLASLSQQLEDSLNKHSEDVQLTFDQQQQAIEHLSMEQAQQNQQQSEVNGEIQKQLRLTNDKISSLEDRDGQQDKAYDRMVRQIDELQDEIQKLTRKNKSDLQNELKDSIENLQKQQSEIVENLNKKLLDQNKDIQYEQDLFKKRFDDINQRLNMDVNQEKLQDLEKMIRSLDNVQVMVDLRKRVEELEEEVQNMAIKSERDIKTVEDRLKFGFEEDQRRQDRIVQQLSQDCDFRFESSNKFIEKVNQEKTQDINELQENLTNFKKQFKEDQLRQDENLDNLKSVLGDIQGLPKTDKSLELKLQSIEDDLIKLFKKQKDDLENVLNSQDKQNKAQKAQEQTIDQIATQLTAQKQSQKQLYEEIEKKLDQESKLQTLDNQRLERKLGMDLDNGLQQMDETMHILNERQQQHQANVQGQLDELKQIQDQENEQVNQNINQLSQNLQEQDQKNEENSQKQRVLEDEIESLKKQNEIMYLKPDEKGNISQEAIEQIQQSLKKELEVINLKQKQQQELLDQHQGLLDQIVVDVQKVGDLDKDHKLEIQKLEKDMTDLQTYQTENLSKQIEKLQQEIQAHKENQDQQQQEQIEQQQKDLEDMEAKNMQLINEIQDQLLKLDENNQNNLQSLADQVNSFVTDVDSQIKILGENDQTHLENANQLQEQINQLTIKEQEQDQRLDALEQKTEDINLEMSELKMKQEQDLDTFKDNICKDFEFMEDQVVGALQNDTVDLIHRTQVVPLEVRVTNLERNNNMAVSQVFDQEIVKSPPKLSKEEEEDQVHKKLLSEMKRRRLWYLRKTPQDYIIEELMLKHRCTQEKAEQIYLRQLQKNKLIKQSPENSQRNNNGTSGAQVTGDSSNFLGIKHIYENIIHATTPRKSERGNSRPSSRQGLNNLEIGSQHIQPTNVMRQPHSPYQGSLQVEPDYEEVKRLSPYNQNSPGSKAPYIVFNSPMHEETVQQIEIVPVNKKQNQTQKTQNPNLMKVPTQQQRRNQQIDIDDMDDDWIEESNIDVDELDGNNLQMRQNLDNLIESPNIKQYQEEFRGRRRDGNYSVNFSKETMPKNSFGNGSSTQTFLKQIEKYSPPSQKINSARNKNRNQFNSTQQQPNFNETGQQSAFKMYAQPFQEYSQESLKQSQNYNSKHTPQNKLAGKAQVQLVDEEWGSGDKLSQENQPDIFLPQYPQKRLQEQRQLMESVASQQNKDNKSSYHNDDYTKSQINEFVAADQEQMQEGISDQYEEQDNDDYGNQDNDVEQQQQYYEEDDGQHQQEEYVDNDYDNEDDDQMQQQQQMMMQDQENSQFQEQHQEYYDDDQDSQKDPYTYQQQPNQHQISNEDDLIRHIQQHENDSQLFNNGDLSYQGSINYDYQESLRASHERNSLPQQYSQNRQQENHSDNIFISNQKHQQPQH
eukprot:403336271